jgi:hypothetical protein
MSALGLTRETVTTRPGWGLIEEVQRFLFDGTVFIFNEAEHFGELSPGPPVTVPIKLLGRQAGSGILDLWS